MGSTRLPGKVLKEINGLPLIVHVYRRLLACKELDNVLISWGGQNEELDLLCNEYGLYAFRGSENDLIARHSIAAHQRNADAFVRVTADCLFHDPAYIDAMVAGYRHLYPQFRGLSNWKSCRYISEGLDAEIYSMELMSQLDHDPNCPREDFATYAAKNNLVTQWCGRDEPLGEDIHLSIDTQEDFDRAEKMLKILGNDCWEYSKTLKAYKAVMAEE